MNNEIEAESQKVVNEYRCTRSDLYKEVTCVGHHDLSARNGHYIVTSTPDEAFAEMQKRYPDEKGFTVTLWKQNVYTYTVLTVE